MRDNYLNIFPTSRAIRAKKESFLESNTLLPKFITIAEFEQKAILVKGSKLIDNTIRALYLKEAANFSEFKSLKSDLSLLKFYTKADDFFRFFEEVSAEGVTIKELFLADSYAEFERDLDILQTLLSNYKALLEKDNLTDKIFIPNEFSLNEAFINSFDGFILELEGYLTKFELELINKISKIKPFIIRVKSSRYNQKVINSFRDLGINLPNSSYIEFNLSTKEIISAKPYKDNIDSEVVEVALRLEQIAIAFAKVEEFVKNGIKPQNIAIILPDESLAPLFKAYDKFNNLNLAMGEAYRDSSSYILLEELYRALNSDKLAKEYIAKSGIDLEKALSFADNKIEVNTLFNYLKELDILPYSSDSFEEELDKINLLDSYFRFCKVFEGFKFSFKEWLFLWLDRIKKHTLDDVGGGKVTVMGVLESRGVSFDGVIIVDFNDSKVPSVSNKDRFLNSAVRAYAKLPTKEDRENLQKYYYSQILQNAKRSVIIYQKDDENLPSKFLYELGLDSKVTKYKVPLNILYDLKSNYNPKSHEEDIEVEFKAKDFVWSATMLKSFLDCKRKFYYRYIKGISEPTSDELNEGRELHNILSKVIVPNRVYSSVEELKKEFMIALDSLNGDIELFYKKPLWVNMLKPFFKESIEHFNSGWRVVNKEFSLRGSIAGLEFSGRVDRLDKKDNLNLVIDYKSGSIKAANQKDVEKVSDFQMNIYARLLDMPNTNFAFWELFSGDLTYLDGFESKDEKLLEHIEYLKSLDSLVASRCDNLQNCRYCPYQLLCHRGEYL